MNLLLFTVIVHALNKYLISALFKLFKAAKRSYLYNYLLMNINLDQTEANPNKPRAKKAGKATIA